MSFEAAVNQLEQTNADLVKEVVRVRDAAMGLNRIYPSTSAGIAAVEDGKYFAIPGTGDTYMILYRRNGSAANEISRYPSQAAVDEIVNLLGSAAYVDVMADLTDTTAGRLMPVGAFGLGRSDNIAEVSDFSVWRPTMFYGGPGSLPVDAPPGVSGRAPSLNIGSATYGIEFYFDVNKTDSAADTLFWSRRWRGGAPNSDWLKFFHSHNILGTVSQSGGVPTGASFETGESGQGRWFKYADGRAEAYLTRNSTAEQAARLSNLAAGDSGTFLWDLPISFVSVDEMAANANWGSNDGVVRVIGEPQRSSNWTVSQVPINWEAKTGVASSAIQLTAHVVGRWF